MSDCCADTCGPGPKSEAERRTLTIALVLNGSMFVAGLAAALIGQSAGLLADALDMLTDAITYGLSLWAIGRSAHLKATTARVIGSILLLLGAGVILESGRKAVFGSEPVGLLMMGMALLSLAVNVTILRMLSKFRGGDVNFRGVVHLHPCGCGRQLRRAGFRRPGAVDRIAISGSDRRCGDRRVRDERSSRNPRPSPRSSFRQL